jgi:hypothetical protein
VWLWPSLYLESCENAASDSIGPVWGLSCCISGNFWVIRNKGQIKWTLKLLGVTANIYELPSQAGHFQGVGDCEVGKAVLVLHSSHDGNSTCGWLYRSLQRRPYSTCMGAESRTRQGDIPAAADKPLLLSSIAKSCSFCPVSSTAWGPVVQVFPSWAMSSLKRQRTPGVVQ